MVMAKNNLRLLKDNNSALFKIFQYRRVMAWWEQVKILGKPCFGFYLLGSIKQIAIANSFVALSSMIIFGAGIYEFLPRREAKEVNESELQGKIRPVFWIIYYLSWSSEVYLSLYLYMAADQRNHIKCKLWLRSEIFFFILFLSLFLAHTFWLHGFNPILEACFGVICIYKAYTFWVVSCYIRQNIEINQNYKFLNDLPDETIENFLRGYPVGKRDSLSFSHPVHQKPYNANFEIAPNMIEKIHEIGSGEFGTVYKGLYRKQLHNSRSCSCSATPESHENPGSSMIVAIKCVKTNADPADFTALLDELKIMMYIGQHPNIVNLIGACTSNIKHKKLDLVVEYCEYKSLDLYLQSRQQGQFVSLLDAKGNISVPHLQSDIQDSSGFIQSISTEDLIRWSLDTARGMEYLYARNVIHGDLAARNVLLSEDKRAKISDFGLSRRIQSYRKRYVRSDQKLLPWRSIAPECLNKHRLQHQLPFYPESDIWSYGVTIWEFFSLGDVPYSHLDFTTEFRTRIQNGTLKLEKPPYAPNQVYELMLNCWKVNRNERVPFRTIISSLESVLEEFFPTNSAAHSSSPYLQVTKAEISSTSSSDNHYNPVKQVYIPLQMSIDPGDARTEGIPIEIVHPPRSRREDNRRTVSENSCTISACYVMSAVEYSDEHV